MPRCVPLQVPWLGFLHFVLLHRCCCALNRHAGAKSIYYLSKGRRRPFPSCFRRTFCVLALLLCCCPLVCNPPQPHSLCLRCRLARLTWANLLDSAEQAAGPDSTGPVALPMGPCVPQEVIGGAIAISAFSNGVVPMWVIGRWQ